MPEHKNNLFRDMNIREKTATIVGIGSLIILVLSFVIGLYFFGLAGIFELLGVQYNSIWSLAIFVISFLILGIIVEIFFKVIYKLSVRNITGRIKVFFVRISVAALSNWLVLFTVDEFMKSMILSIRSEIIIALLLVILEVVFDDDKYKRKE
ncbi:YrvL family regulatory protein [Virgibacillus salexigens]|uniref:YrvL family regulatory protein n=1 Tax=Virgibacillus salexigens TaxID=61016 RepID=UPI00190B4593|nr:YrvL family regulatory protein [Virgibacillus salexigens]